MIHTAYIWAVFNLEGRIMNKFISPEASERLIRANSDASGSLERTEPNEPRSIKLEVDIGSVALIKDRMCFTQQELLEMGAFA